MIQFFDPKHTSHGTIKPCKLAPAPVHFTYTPRAIAAQRGISTPDSVKCLRSVGCLGVEGCGYKGVGGCVSDCVWHGLRMGAGHSAEGDGATSDPPTHSRRKTHNRRRRKYNSLYDRTEIVKSKMRLAAGDETTRANPNWKRSVRYGF
ncbi:unnamed protein product [Danaus chrysippus]|uniref:(African queen) hypothetical protein n=1 Tax=Danaus chrysippus TaxID=151541 RepID=A0A8J2QKM2_9NEOP|nr:unnamed protein product [Danaus chrysippus]